MKYEELTRKIIGCAMKVHSTLGNGFTHKFKLFLKVFSDKSEQAVSASQFKRSFISDV
jgi:hypothetical protein